MSHRFPALEPYDSGLLDVSDAQQIYWECCGNPAGKPALYLHGGPGSGCTPNARRFFNPALYRAVLFDQRGSGRSSPLASDAHVDLSANTTAPLIADIEALRCHVGVQDWTVLGLSWGCTLALAYAQAHPRRVTALVLGPVTTTSRREVIWITQDVGRIFPREWDRFAEAVPPALRHPPLVDAYAILLCNADPAVHQEAAREWCAWEEAHVSLVPGYQPNPRYDDPLFRLRFARLVTHYWRHAAFLEEDQLLRDAARLNGIPGVLVHGRYDVSGPLETAWRLSQRWRSSRLHVIDDAGHGDGDLLHATLLDAVEEFATT